MFILSVRGHCSVDVVKNMAVDSDGKEDFVSFGTPLEPLEEGRDNIYAFY